VLREWTDEGVPLAQPGVDEIVCAYTSSDPARNAYQSQSLYKIGGEGWPNFEPGADDRTSPRNLESLKSLHADEWELGGTWLREMIEDEIEMAGGTDSE